MTDRELIELAAKAVGYGVVQYHTPTHGNGQLSGAWAGPWLEVHKPEAPLGACRWNPLVDDGDALRLALKLLISIDPRAGATCAIAGEGKHVVLERYIGSEVAPATRRAIVRAAAEIAKAMP